EAAAARTGTDTRFSLWEEHFVDPDGNKVPIDHLAWAPTLNNMLMNDGTLYLDKDDVAVKSTLIDWFNAQTRSANLARAAKNPYTDVSKDGWAYASIKNAFDTGIVVGVGGNKYEPDSPFTTAQWLTILYRFAKNSFDDKAAQGANWMEAAQYLNELLELEYDEAGLDAAITREEMAFIATKVLKYTDVEYKAIKDPIEFTDAEQITQEYKDAVTWCSSVVGINGIPEDEGAFSFNPGGNLKRSEAAQVAYNIINVLTVEPAA
ncbi:MAG: S-layer homology domain-containing protein, partial [Clostridiales bacterium]|nr:S-layer homology domain-containing protein [Clostridiales bacterium]